MPSSALRMEPGFLETTERRPDGRGCILLVDDSAELLSMLELLFWRHGYRTLTARDAEEALELLGEQTPDVVVTDVDMPGKSGIALCGLIRTMLHRPVHIIILSGYEDRVVDGLNAGAADYICKPFVAAELIARVASGVRAVQREKSLLADTLQLERSFARVAAERERLGRDLAEAAGLQASLLPPRVLRRPGLTVSSAVRPDCVLSGDMVGVTFPTPETLAIYGIDVSGHGTSAALLATSISLELRGDGGRGEPPLIGGHNPSSACDVVQRLNDRLIGIDGFECYSTLAYAILDRRRCEGAVCVAGHPRPALIDPDGEVRFIGDGGSPVGLLADARYEATTFGFAPGSRLVLLSDGLIEARMPGGQQVGYRGVAELLRTLTGTPTDTLAPTLIGAITQRLGGQTRDDVSVIVAGAEPLETN